MEKFICVTCGVQYSPTAATPEHCRICTDDRQYVNWQGQTWTTQSELQQNHRNEISLVEPGLYKIHTIPKFGIGQKAFLMQSPGGNILWDAVTFLDENTISSLQNLGGIQAIAISHPHYYANIVDWSRTFGNIPIYIHACDQEWVTEPDTNIRFWEGSRFELWDDICLINCGGHFPGASVLYWPAGANHQGVVLSGDTIQVVMDRKSVSFMYSYPNLIPLPEAQIKAISESMAGLAFERMYGAFEPHIGERAREAFDRSITRYLQIFK